MTPSNLTVKFTPSGETVLALPEGWNRIYLTPSKTDWLIKQLQEKSSEH